MQARNQAVREYQESKDKARFQQLAQKLAQHLNNLAEVESTKIRWIWELIQNAKDVPNQFNKTRMRIEIRENKLIFAHNGDPFRVSDLESLVAQYSSKPQENKTNIETTGKYGTGFITTYILSRKVRIKGLLGLKTKKEIEEEQRKERGEVEEEENVEILSESSLKGESKPVKKVYKFQASEDEGLDVSSQHLQEGLNRPENKRNKIQGNSLYQKFQIFLDRDYKDRDKELFRKLMETEHMLMENLMSSQPQPRWQRKQTELNTQFIYEELDEPAFRMIDEAIVALKELFPYVILFNPKIYQLQMIDKRKGHRLKNFGLKRIEESQNGPIKIFNVLHLEQGQDNRTISLAYIEDELTYSTIAVPIYVHPDNKLLQVLQVNHNLPKIFKEFPLIGCNDTGFNFCFTSRRFYPNQSRSDLLLRGIQGRSSSKANSNWDALQQIFKKVKILYKQLAQIAQEGQQNHLIIAVSNQFTSVKEYQNHQLAKLYKEIMEDILDSNFVEFRNGRKGNLRELRYVYGKSTSQIKISAQAYSCQLNDVFAFLVGESFVFSSEWHEKFYIKLMSSRKQWQGSVRYHDINLCLTYFRNLKFDNLKFLFQNSKNAQEAAFQALQKLYGFLKIHNAEYMAYSENESNSSSNSMFALTNSLKFQNLNSRIHDTNILRFQKLTRKEGLPIAYEELGKILRLNIQQFTVHDRMAPYFSNLTVFNKESMIRLFNDYFFHAYKDVESNETRDKIIFMGRFMKTLGISSAAFQVLQGLKNYEGMNELKVSSKDNIKIPPAEQSKYVIFFETKVLMTINAIINKSEKLSRLIDYYLISKEENKALNWLNKLFSLQRNLFNKNAGLKDNQSFKKAYSGFYLIPGASLFGEPNKTELKDFLIERNLSMTKKFCLMDDLKYFCEVKHEKDFIKGNYPDQRDLQIFQRYRIIHNSLKNSFTGNKYNPISKLQDCILHESINQKFPKYTLFKHQFAFINRIYIDKYLNKEQKIDFMDYLDFIINQSYEKPETSFKLVPFEKVIDRMYYDYARETDCIKKKEDREFLFHLLKNPDQIQLLRQIKKLSKFQEVLPLVKKEKDGKK